MQQRYDKKQNYQLVYQLTDKIKDKNTHQGIQQQLNEKVFVKKTINQQKAEKNQFKLTHITDEVESERKKTISKMGFQSENFHDEQLLNSNSQNHQNKKYFQQSNQQYIKYYQHFLFSQNNQQKKKRNLKLILSYQKKFSSYNISHLQQECLGLGVNIIKFTLMKRFIEFEVKIFHFSIKLKVYNQMYDQGDLLLKDFQTFDKFIQKHAVFLNAGGNGTIYRINKDDLNLHEESNKYHTKNRCFVMKHINFTKQFLKAQLKTYLVQYAINKLLSCFQIGPKIIYPFGDLDIIVTKNGFNFFMQECETISSHTSYLLKNNIKFVEKINQQVQSQLKLSLVLLHELKIVHYDIKPENIMYSKQFKKYVFIDFGLAEYKPFTYGYIEKQKFKGTIYYCSQQMKRLFSESRHQYIDVFYNDTYCLSKSLQIIKKDVQMIYYEIGTVHNNPDEYDIIANHNNMYKNYVQNNIKQNEEEQSFYFHNIDKNRIQDKINQVDQINDQMIYQKQENLELDQKEQYNKYVLGQNNKQIYKFNKVFIGDQRGWLKNLNILFAVYEKNMKKFNHCLIEYKEFIKSNIGLLYNQIDQDFGIKRILANQIVNDCQLRDYRPFVQIIVNLKEYYTNNFLNIINTNNQSKKTYLKTYQTNSSKLQSKNNNIYILKGYLIIYQQFFTQYYDYHLIKKKNRVRQLIKKDINQNINDQSILQNQITNQISQKSVQLQLIHKLTRFMIDLTEVDLNKLDLEVMQEVILQIQNYLNRITLLDVSQIQRNIEPMIKRQSNISVTKTLNASFFKQFFFLLSKQIYKFISCQQMFLSCIHMYRNQKLFISIFWEYKKVLLVYQQQFKKQLEQNLMITIKRQKQFIKYSINDLQKRLKHYYEIVRNKFGFKVKYDYIRNLQRLIIRIKYAIWGFITNQIFFLVRYYQRHQMNKILHVTVCFYQFLQDIQEQYDKKIYQITKKIWNKIQSTTTELHNYDSQYYFYQKILKNQYLIPTSNYFICDLALFYHHFSQLLIQKFIYGSKNDFQHLYQKVKQVRFLLFDLNKKNDSLILLQHQYQEFILNVMLQIQIKSMYSQGKFMKILEMYKYMKQNDNGNLLLNEQNGIFNKVIGMIRAYYKKTECDIKTDYKKTGINNDNRGKQGDITKNNSLISYKNNISNKLDADTKTKSKGNYIKKINKDPSLNQIQKIRNCIQTSLILFDNLFQIIDKYDEFLQQDRNDSKQLNNIKLIRMYFKSKYHSIHGTMKSFYDSLDEMFPKLCDLQVIVLKSSIFAEKQSEKQEQNILGNTKQEQTLLNSIQTLLLNLLKIYKFLDKFHQRQIIQNGQFSSYSNHYSIVFYSKISQNRKIIIFHTIELFYEILLAKINLNVHERLKKIIEKSEIQGKQRQNLFSELDDKYFQIKISEMKSINLLQTVQTDYFIKKFSIIQNTIKKRKQKIKHFFRYLINFMQALIALSDFIKQIRKFLSSQTKFKKQKQLKSKQILVIAQNKFFIQFKQMKIYLIQNRMIQHLLITKQGITLGVAYMQHQQFVGFFNKITQINQYIVGFICQISTQLLQYLKILQQDRKILRFFFIQFYRIYVRHAVKAIRKKYALLSNNQSLRLIESLTAQNLCLQQYINKYQTQFMPEKQSKLNIFILILHLQQIFQMVDEIRNNRDVEKNILENNQLKITFSRQQVCLIQQMQKMEKLLNKIRQIMGKIVKKLTFGQINSQFLNKTKESSARNHAQEGKSKQIHQQIHARLQHSQSSYIQNKFQFSLNQQHNLHKYPNTYPSSTLTLMHSSTASSKSPLFQIIINIIIYEMNYYKKIIQIHETLEQLYEKYIEILSMKQKSREKQGQMGCVKLVKGKYKFGKIVNKRNYLKKICEKINKRKGQG